MSKRIPFSYAVSVDSAWRKRLIRSMEALTGAAKLSRLYNQRFEHYEQGLDVWTTAARLLQLKIHIQHGTVEQIPRSGPVVIVANHPFGLVDGIAICQLALSVRPDFKIMINSVLEQVEDIRPFLLPIDFSPRPDAVATNLEARAHAREQLRKGHVVIVFAGGGVSTARNVFGTAVDPPWQSFVAKLIQTSQSTVVPVYFHGQNSWLFHAASRVSLSLRLGLLVREVVNKIGSRIDLSIGRRIAPSELDSFGSRRELLHHLRLETYRLAAGPSDPRLTRCAG